jgi:hypothetical protein
LVKSLVVAGLVALGSAASALACSCLHVSDDPDIQLPYTYGQADLIFAGVVRAAADLAGVPLTDSYRCGQPGPVCSALLVDIDVETVWRGFAGRRITVQADARECSYHFVVGRKYFIAAKFPPTRSGFAITSSCSGNFQFTEPRALSRPLSEYLGAPVCEYQPITPANQAGAADVTRRFATGVAADPQSRWAASATSRQRK